MIDPENKLCGVLIPVFAMRRKGDLGIGDTRAVREAIEFCKRNNLSILQLLPINETGGDNSPYGAISSVALDPALISTETELLPGLEDKERESIIDRSGIKSISNRFVDYRLVKRLKLDLLRAAWSKFREECKGRSKDAESFKQFEKEHQSWLPAYTLFRSLIDLYGGNSCWTQWQEEHKSISAAETWLKKYQHKEKIEDDRRFYAYVQWLAFSQWAELRRFADKNSVSLMGDIPFGVSRYSCDVWSERDLFDLEWSGGAPPEPLFQDDKFTAKWGQNWGIPLYSWDAHEKDNYRWWRRRVGKLTEIFHYFRIDHVLGFFRIYAFPWIPERNAEFLDLSEEEAKELTEGRLPHFVPREDYPEEMGELNAAGGEAILRVIMEASGKSGVVAEDLGTVPPYVRPLLHKMGIPGFAIPIFERDEEDNSFKKKEDLHPLSIATYATHDHMPLRLFYEDLVRRWHGADGHEAWLDVQRLMRFLEVDDENPPREFSEDLHEALERALLQSPCWAAIFMMPDILGSSEQFNVPGTGGEGNWTQRLSMTLAEYENDIVFGPRIKRLSGMIREEKRLHADSAAGSIKK